MSLIFLSHTEEDFPITEEIAHGLEEAGYSTWYYERDTIPGTSYLLQITRAIESCDAIVLIASPNSMASSQVTKEVIYAFEGSRAMFPVLKDLTPDELKERQPEWSYALGGIAMINMDPEDPSSTATSISEGLISQGIQPGKAKAPVSPVLSTPGTHAPRTLTNKVLSQRASLEGERKQVTVLSCGICPTTSQDPEELHEIMKPCMDMMIQLINGYEGTVASISSEGLTALFGAPIAHEDDPRRALHAALSLREHAGKQGLSVSIGLNTGMLIVGSIGEDLAMEYTAIGDTVSLASRLREVAGLGEALSSEETYRLAQGYFDFEELHPEVIPPIKTFRVLAPLQAATRVEASLPKGLSPFVGRGKELEHLKDCWELAQDGQGQVVGILGEAGVGKSRLLLQFFESLPSEEYTYLQGGCLHYGEAIAYLPMLDLLRRYFDISEGEDQSSAKEKVAERLTGFETALDSILPPLYEVLSLPVEDESYTSLEPQQRRQLVFEAIRNLLIAISQQRPLILAVEDLHWIDKTSEEFLTYLIDGLVAAPILLILLYRPEYNPIWTTKSSYSQIRVDQLPKKNSEELISYILSEGEVSPEITDLITAKAYGNPLFIEELTHGLIENGSVVKDNEHYSLSGKPSELQIPDTIQGIIASRLDRLEENLKRIIQVASVIGMEFAYRLLQAITGAQEELKTSLAHLQGLEFIYEKSLFPEPVYMFKHALTQEVAYSSLLLKKRKELHGKIGDAIERLYPDRLEEFYEVLAYHYAASENVEKTLEYLMLSGEKAARSYANWEAVGFYREALRVLDTQAETEKNNGEKLRVCRSVIDIMMLLNYPEGSLETLEESVRLAQELEDDRSLMAVYRRFSLYHSIKGDVGLGMEYSEKCMEAAERIGDVYTIAGVASSTSMARFFTGDVLGAAEISRRALKLIEEQRGEHRPSIGRWTVHSQLSGWCGFSLAGQGEFEEARAVLERGLESSFEAKDTLGTGWVEFSTCSLYWFKGDGASLVSHARRAVECFEETGVDFTLGGAWSFLGNGHLLLGKYEEARDCAEKGLKLQRQTGTQQVNIPLCLTNLATVLMAVGAYESAVRCADEALKLSQEIKAKLWEGLAWTVLGKALGSADPKQIDVAEQHLRQGIYMTEELNLKPYAMHGYLYLGELFEMAKQGEEAIENLKIAEKMGVEMGMGYWLTRTREALTRLER